MKVPHNFQTNFLLLSLNSFILTCWSAQHCMVNAPRILFYVNSSDAGIERCKSQDSEIKLYGWIYSVAPLRFNDHWYGACIDCADTKWCVAPGLLIVDVYDAPNNQPLVHLKMFASINISQSLSFRWSRRTIVYVTMRFCFRKNRYGTATCSS